MKPGAMPLDDEDEDEGEKHAKFSPETPSPQHAKFRKTGFRKPGTVVLDDDEDDTPEDA